MDYEEYMRSVLGYSQIPNNIYTNSYDNYYYDTNYINNQNRNTSTEIIETMYPDIYRIVYPMVCRVCTQNSQREITMDLINSMTDEVFMNVEPVERPNQNVNAQRPILKNGDVRNPNAKEPEQRTRETRQNNFLLRDLIRILLLKEWGRPNRPPIRPPFPPGGGRPPMGPGPGMPPPNRPPRPPMGPPQRPRYF